MRQALQRKILIRIRFLLFLRNEFSKKKLLKNLKLNVELEVDVREILTVIGCKIFSSKLLKLQVIHESLPTACGLIWSIFV